LNACIASINIINPLRGRFLEVFSGLEEGQLLDLGSQIMRRYRGEV